MQVFRRGSIIEGMGVRKVEGLEAYLDQEGSERQQTEDEAVCEEEVLQGIDAALEFSRERDKIKHLSLRDANGCGST